MIKRYGLGANPDAITPNSMRPGLVQIVEREDGDYVRYEDYAAALAKSNNDADMYWDDDDLERGYSSIEEVVDDCVSNYDMAVGSKIGLQRAKKLPMIEIVITEITDGFVKWEKTK